MFFSGPKRMAAQRELLPLKSCRKESFMNQKEMRDALAARDETALKLIAARYGPYIRKIAFGILHSEEDAEEVENDVYLKLWRESENGLPADVKQALGLYARQIAIDRLRIISAARRGSREYALALEELSEVLEDTKNRDPADRIALKDAMSGFLKGLPQRDRQLFVCRYWYAMSLGECVKAFRVKESTVKTTLHRLQKKLREHLEKEGIII